MVPNGWDLVEAQDICQRISVGIVVKPKDYYVPEGDGVKAFRSANVREGYIEDSNWTYISDAGHQKNKKSILQTGDVLIVRTGYPGTACVVPEQYAGANCIDIIFARPDQTRVLPEYLCDFTNSEYGKKQVLDGQGGLAQQHFNVGAYNKLRVPLPPLPEQKKIAEILSTWDRAIETAEALLTTARTQKRALMQTLLTGKRRFPEFEGQEWREVPLNKIAEPVSDRNSGDDIPVLTISSKSGFVRQDDKYSRNMAGKSVERYYRLREGDFAYNKGNSLTYPFGCVLRLDECVEGLVPHVYVCFRLKDGYSSDFYRGLFLADYLKPQLSRLVNTGVRNNGLLNISPSAFWTVTVPAPPLPEQEKIGRVMADCLDEETRFVAKIEKLRTEKKALMQQLLTGKRRVALK